MDNALIIDLVLLAALLLGAVLGWRRGLIRTVMGLTAVILALLGASLLTNLLTGPVTDLVYPKVQEKLLSQLEQPLSPDGEEQPRDPQQPDESGLLDGVLEKLRRFGVDGEETVKAAGEAGLNVFDAAARALVRTVVQAALFLLCFLLLTLALTLVSHMLGLIFRLPLLGGINALGGALIGFVEALLLVYLALWLAPRLGITFFAGYASRTHLLAFLMQNTLNTLWTRLIKA